jgi:serine/threonine-protein kinase RsbW
MKRKKQFVLSIENIPEILLWAHAQAEVFGFSKRELLHIEIATEEVLANILFHSYKSKKEKIFLEISENKEFWQLQIEDQGPQFNPLAFPKKLEKEKALEERKEGGIGLHLIEQCIDEIEYFRKNQKNILILKKNRPTLEKKKKA